MICDRCAPGHLAVEHVVRSWPDPDERGKPSAAHWAQRTCPVEQHAGAAIRAVLADPGSASGPRDSLAVRTRICCVVGGRPDSIKDLRAPLAASVGAKAPASQCFPCSQRDPAGSAGAFGSRGGLLVP
jgi:hypothetical protein